MSKQEQGDVSKLFMNTISEEVNNLCVSIKKRDSIPSSRMLDAQDALCLFNRSPQECMLNNPFSNSNIYEEIFQRSKKNTGKINSTSPQIVKTSFLPNDCQENENVEILELNLAEKFRKNDYKIHGASLYSLSDSTNGNNVVALSVNYIRQKYELHIHIHWTAITSAHLKPGHKVFAKVYLTHNKKQTQATKIKEFKDDLTWNEDIKFTGVRTNDFKTISFTIKIFRKKKFKMGKTLIALAHL